MAPSGAANIPLKATVLRHLSGTHGLCVLFCPFEVSAPTFYAKSSATCVSAKTCHVPSLWNVNRIQIAASEIYGCLAILCISTFGDCVGICGLHDQAHDRVIRGIVKTNVFRTPGPFASVCVQI